MRGRWGRAFDRLLVRCLGVSVITWQYARAAGRPYTPTLLLTTIGRRSGRLRPRALPYHRIDGSYVVVGSNGGGPTDPDWVWNVRSDPTAWVHVDRREVPVRAHVAEGDERARLAEAVSARTGSFAGYEERAATFGRTVPLVVLEPVAAAPAGEAPAPSGGAERRSWQLGLPEERSFGFAQAVGVGPIVHVSGQVGFDGDQRPADMEGQMRIAYRRLARVLEQAGATMADVVEETVFVTDLAAASRAAKVVRPEVYGARPEVASTMVGVAAIGHPHAEPALLVEVRGSAVVGGTGPAR